MANTVVLNFNKQPLKFVEIPLNKFSEEVIPHHQKIYDQYRTTIHKLISVHNVEQLSREIKEKKRVVKQLKDLMYELDTLRTHVEDEDLDTFDTKTLSLRKIILTLISGYTDLEKASNKLIHPIENSLDEGEKENYQNPFYGVEQIQANVEDFKLKQKQNTLEQVEGIHKEVEDLHEMHRNLNDLVHVQGEQVDVVEENVENAQQNIESGVKHIIKAHKLKAVAYPATGALLGGIIGGPIGLLAGLKIGGIVALGGALAGYTGGRFFKTMHDPDNIQPEQENSDQQVDSDNTEKKDT